MKISTFLIWLFEFGATAFLGVCAWRSETALIYFFLMALIVILAIFGNKHFKIQANGVNVEVEDDEDEKNAN